MLSAFPKTMHNTRDTTSVSLADSLAKVTLDPAFCQEKRLPAVFTNTSIAIAWLQNDFATAFTNTPGETNIQQATCLIGNRHVLCRSL